MRISDAFPLHGNVADAPVENVAGSLERAMPASRRNIIVYGMNYAPEMAGVGRYTGEIAEYFTSLGMDVAVVTTPPHYPGWRVEEGSANAYSSRLENGVRVYRAPLLVRRKIHGIWRLLAPLSFALTSAPLLFRQIARQRPDVICCIQPTLLVAPAAQVAARLTGARTVLHVHDLEVDAAFAVGHLGGFAWLKWLAYTFERLMLGRFDRVVTISVRMAEKLEVKGVSRDRLAVVRNWVDLSHIFPMDEASPYRAELGYDDQDFVVLYSGTIGAKQGLSVLLDAAVRLRNEEPRIRFVVAGEGPSKAELQACYGHLENVRFLPFQPYERLNEFLNMADVHVLPQVRGTADLVLPSKLGCMLATGGPIIATADHGTELARFLDGAAILTPPEDAGMLAQAILKSRRGDTGSCERRLDLGRLLARADGLPNLMTQIIG